MFRAVLACDVWLSGLSVKSGFEEPSSPVERNLKTSQCSSPIKASTTMVGFVVCQSAFRTQMPREPIRLVVFVVDLAVHRCMRKP